jgi:hypothetical protein
MSNFPPCLMKLKIHKDGLSVNLWLPVIIAWLILAALAIAVAPLVLILILILWPLGWGKFLMMLAPRFYQILCALKNLDVDVANKEQHIAIAFK